jgi:hypothetical protein
VRILHAWPVFAALSLTTFLFAACETKNIGGPIGPPPPPRLIGITLSPSQPAGGYLAGTEVTATVSFSGGSGIYTFTLSFPGAEVTPATQSVNSQLPFDTTATLTFTINPFMLADDADGKDVSFTLAGSDYNTGYTGGYLNGTFHVVGIPNAPPTVSAVAGLTGSVEVTVDDPEGDDVTVSPSTVPAAFSSPPSQTVTGGHGSAPFVFESTDIFAGGTGDVTFSADDGQGNVVYTTVTVTSPPIGPFTPDTLFAIPLVSEIFAGDSVTIVVATAVTANPFQYMNNVRVTIPQASGAQYVGGTSGYGGTGDAPGSFDVGLPGGGWGDVDGFWTCMAPAGGFLMPVDSFIRRSDAGGGLYGFDFNLTPLGGSDTTTCEGALFNFRLLIPNAGTWQLGFQQDNIVPRTYYQDGNIAPVYYWGDISNDHAGIPNSVTVN